MPRSLNTSRALKINWYYLVVIVRINWNNESRDVERNKWTNELR